MLSHTRFATPRAIGGVNNINDPRLLVEHLQAIDLEYEIEHLHQLTDDRKTAIDQGTVDAESGNLHSNA